MLKFYDVDENYIDYLKTIDSKVPDIRYITNNKFVTGILISINDCEYFAPVSSFNVQQRTNFLIYDRTRTISSVRFSFMFPVPTKIKSKVIYQKDFAKETNQQQIFLRKELNYINKHLSEVLKKANDIYKGRIDNKEFFVTNCCNFKLLEEKCKLYIPEFYIYQDREQGKLDVFAEEKTEDRYNLYGLVKVPKDQIGIVRDVKQLSDKTTFALIDENGKNKSFYSTLSNKVYETIDKLNEEVQSISQ